MAPKLIPIQQWFCDSCREVIRKPEHGYLEWRPHPGHGPRPRRRAGCRLVHNALHSLLQTEEHQRRDGTNCYDNNLEGGGDFELSHFVGHKGLIALTAWIGVDGDKDHESPGPALDLREWTVLFMRLHVPYYEEARLYFDHSGGSKDASFYLPENLKALIEKYREGDEIQTSEGKASI